MLATSGILVCILWYRLGGSADYSESKHVHAAEETDSVPEIPLPAAELDDRKGRA